jgi:hypothetical protein
MLRFGFPLIVEPHFSSTNRAGRGMTTFCAWRPSQRRLRMISNPPFAMYRRHLDQCPLWADSCRSWSADRLFGLYARAKFGGDVLADVGLDGSRRPIVL